MATRKKKEYRDENACEKERTRKRMAEYGRTWLTRKNKEEQDVFYTLIGGRQGTGARKDNELEEMKLIRGY